MTIKDAVGIPAIAIAMATSDDANLVQIWRRHRDGSESYERLPEFLAKIILAEVPYNEPDTERAKIIRSSPNLDYFLLADLAQLMVKQPATEAA